MVEKSKTPQMNVTIIISILKYMKMIRMEAKLFQNAQTTLLISIFKDKTKT
jgi:hypothetical protein